MEKIKVSKNGPYLVEGKIPLSKQIIGTNGAGDSIDWKQGENYPEKESYTLCRCGHSTNKPFCTGKHSELGFKGEETSGYTSYESQAEKINGPNMTLKDVKSFCASARFCDPLGSTWNLVEKSDNKSKEIAVKQCCNCPSGRLVAYEKDGKEIEPKFKKSIGVVEDPEAGVSGPLWVKGKIPIESAEGKQYEVRNRVTLCRCGRSENKPFCDGAHMTTGFSD